MRLLHQRMWGGGTGGQERWRCWQRRGAGTSRWEPESKRGMTRGSSATRGRGSSRLGMTWQRVWMEGHASKIKMRAESAKIMHLLARRNYEKYAVTFSHSYRKKCSCIIIAWFLSTRRCILFGDSKHAKTLQQICNKCIDRTNLTLAAFGLEEPKLGIIVWISTEYLFGMCNRKALVNHPNCCDKN